MIEKTSLNQGSKRFATSFLAGSRHAEFASRSKVIDVPMRLESLSKREFHISDEVLLFLRVVSAAFREKVLLLFSSRGRLKPELLAMAFIGLWPKRFRPKIIMYGEMFEPNEGFQHKIEKMIMKLVDRAVCRYIVFSSDELQVFPETWRVNSDKIHVCNFYYDPPLENSPPETNPKKNGNHIFAGGNSFRDYDAFVRAAKRMPDQEFNICTTRPIEQDLPSNITVEWPPLDKYLELIDTAAVIVIPIEMGLRRTAGLLTCFEALWLEKPVIVPDALGLRDYILEKETGLIVDGSVEGYIEAIRWALDPNNSTQVEDMCKNARKIVAEKFTLKNFLDNILKIMDEAF